MKFGKQLSTGLYHPWQDKYLAYNKCKRMLKRYSFLRTKRARHMENAEMRRARKLAAKGLGSIDDDTLAATLAAENGDAEDGGEGGESDEGADGDDEVVVEFNVDMDKLNSATEKTPLFPNKRSDNGNSSFDGGDRRGSAKSKYGGSESDLGSSVGGSGGSGSETDGDKEKRARLAVHRLDSTDELIRTTRLMSEDHKTDAAQEFFNVLQQELHKVNEFYKGKLALLEEDLANFEGRRNLRAAWSVPAGNTYAEVKRVYMELEALKMYVELNSEGFRKIVKKYDKVMGADHTPEWKEKLESPDVHFYQAKTPEQLLERCQKLLSRDKRLELLKEVRELHGGQVKETSLCQSLKWGRLGISLLALVLSSQNNITNGENEHAERCLCMLIFVTTMWVSEAIPFFATALLIPVLVILMDVMKHPNSPGPLRAEGAAHLVLNSMMNHTGILIMGSYSISAAFSRCEIELRIASLLQQALGHRPRLFIMGVMYLGLFLSMLIGNHTSPVLLSSILMPIVNDFGTDSSYAKTLLLGMSFACNFGGMVTPISSMQNVVAVEQLDQQGYPISFGDWLMFALPFTCLGVFVTWIVLLIIMQPDTKVSIPIIVYHKERVVTPENILIISLTVLTILGWATISLTKEVFGDIATIALIFMVVAFGSGVLTSVDLNSYSWHTLLLLGGGNVLGQAIDKSELLEILSERLLIGLPHHNNQLLVLEVLTATILVSTFISHTVASLILMPMIVQIGAQVGLPYTLGVGAALAVSAGCALPFSSFPNVTSLMITDDYNRPYLQVKDFVKAGVPMTVISIVLIMTVGMWLIDTVVPAGE